MARIVGTMKITYSLDMVKSFCRQSCKRENDPEKPILMLLSVGGRKLNASLDEMRLLCLGKLLR